ncbi:glutathione S-transferase family protein, partial [Pseudomonas sp. CCI4.2]|nr:glutathione S-transferase family protein [Pseudomonas sp. CCI4.2]
RYTADDINYTGRVTVPVLWDKQQQRIVSNESSEIIRMFNSAFDGLTGNRLDLYPKSLRANTDELNNHIYPSVNNGVYRAGFAT